MVVGERHHDRRLWGNRNRVNPTTRSRCRAGSLGEIADLTRDGAIGVLEFKPNDILHSELDVYYSKFTQDEVMHGAMWTNDPFLPA